VLPLLRLVHVNVLGSGHIFRSKDLGAITQAEFDQIKAKALV
jgi:hypothetical protein